MNINIKATNTTLTPTITQNIHDKFAVLDPFLHSEDKIHVEVEEITRHKNGLTSRVEAHIQPHGQYAEGFGNDFYEALDLVIPKIREQLSRTKDKKISLRRKLGSLFKKGWTK
jgi:ribosomal subunit interface protein